MAMEENMRKVLHRLIKTALTELEGINFDGGMYDTMVHAMNAANIPATHFTQPLIRSGRPAIQLDNSLV